MVDFHLKILSGSVKYSLSSSWKTLPSSPPSRTSFSSCRLTLRTASSRRCGTLSRRGVISSFFSYSNLLQDCYRILLSAQDGDVYEGPACAAQRTAGAGDGARPAGGTLFHRDTVHSLDRVNIPTTLFIYLSTFSLLEGN